MAMRNVIKMGDDILRKRCKTVTVFDKRLFTLIDDMKETLGTVQGLGLAAPQVGVLKRVVIVHYEDKEYEVINPKIIETSGESIDSEGCLSVVGCRGIVKRPQHLKVEFVDRNNVKQIVEADDYFARVFLHEMDHLDGILFVDRMIKRIEMGSEDVKK